MEYLLIYNLDKVDFLENSPPLHSIKPSSTLLVFTMLHRVETLLSIPLFPSISLETILSTPLFSSISLETLHPTPLFLSISLDSVSFLFLNHCVYHPFYVCVCVCVCFIFSVFIIVKITISFLYIPSAKERICVAGPIQSPCPETTQHSATVCSHFCCCLRVNILYTRVMSLSVR